MDEPHKKPIPGTDYLIGEDGVIYSTKRKKGYLTPSVNVNNNLVVCLSNKGKRKTFYVHQLVAAAFLPNPGKDQKYIQFKDGNKQNCAADNLVWSDKMQKT